MPAASPLPVSSRASLHAAALLLAGGLLAGPSAVRAQFVPQRYVLTEAERAELEAGRDRLRMAVERLRSRSARTGAPRPDQLPDVEIYLAGVERNLRQGLFFAPGGVDQARACLAEGEARAAALAAGRSPWERREGFVTLGYRSATDGSVQPYQAYVPSGHDRAQPARLDIFLHGRGGTLNELSFLTSTSWAASSFGTAPPPHLTLYPYGRSNNGWRWAGETDLFEALADLKRRFRVDREQVTLRGFSMGGHGTWHVGLQHPGDWAAMSPGAGFTDTLNYQKLTDPMPDWQRKLLRLYDPIEYVANARNLPVLAYCGDEDPALDQHVQIVERLKQEGAPFREFIGPKTPHRYEPETLRVLMASMAPARRQADASRVHFITYTLRWPECKWVRLEGLERHWDRAEVEARVVSPERLEVTTRNVTALALEPPGLRGGAAVVVDGRRAAAAPGSGPLYLVRRDGRWRPGRPEGLRKRPGLQGPIDDALFGPVMAVAGTGEPWSPGLDAWTRQELRRFRQGWDEYFRARLPERTDADLTREDADGKNLYLFGDPGSNAVLARLLPKLPLRWTRGHFELAGKRYSPEEHLPMLVFPNPESPGRYVVLNCGITFSRADWNGSNALQYPHLPDWAVVRYDAARFQDDRRRDTVAAGFFDERWRLLPGAAPAPGGSR